MSDYSEITRLSIEYNFWSLVELTIDYSDVTCACAVGTQLADPVHIYQTQVHIYQPSRGVFGPGNKSAILSSVVKTVSCGSQVYGM